MPSDLATVIEGLGRPRVLVVGDLILDRYVRGEVNRISPEAPIPVMKVEASRPEDRLGGMANVAHNLIRLGAEVSCVGVVGQDPEGEAVRQMLSDTRASVLGVVSDPARPTTRKTRMISLGQQVLRIDHEVDRPLDSTVLGPLLDRLREAAEEADLIAVSDYAKGVICHEVMDEIREISKKRGIPVVVDPKSPSYRLYRGVTLLTPNRREAETATATLLDEGFTNLDAMARELLRLADLEAVVITLGEKGMFLSRRTGDSLAVPQQARSVYDVTGAGDTVLAILCWALGGGVALEEAVRLANVGAGMVVGRLGASTVTRDELLAEVRNSPYAPSKKILEVSDLLQTLEERRSRGDRVVFTNGCFDLLHPGHVAYLRYARSRGDLLVIALNSDRSVRSLKGEGRPIQGERERAEVLASLEYVDYVVIFDDLTPIDLLKQVRPSVLVKGEDWRDKGVVGRELVESYGGEVCLAPLLPGKSSTEILRRIAEKSEKVIDG